MNRSCPHHVIILICITPFLHEFNTLDACWIAVDVWSNCSRCKIISVYLSWTWCLYNDHCLDIVIIIRGSINCPTVICLPVVCYFSREKPLVKPTPPGLLSHIFAFAFIFRYTKPKNPKYFAALYFICDLLFQSITTFSRQLANFWRRYPKGIVNPFNTSGCEVLLFVCRCCLRSVAWFSYWFNTLVS